MAEASVADADDVSRELDRTMRDASAVVLRGYELPTDEQRIQPGSGTTTNAEWRCGRRCKSS